MEDPNTRIAEVLINNKWQSINPIEIKNGMIFRMFEADGTLVEYKGMSQWLATSDAYYNDDGVITVMTEN